METQMTKNRVPSPVMPEDKLAKGLDDIASAKTKEERQKAKNKYRKEAQTAYLNAETEVKASAVKDVEKQKREHTKAVVEAAKQTLSPEIRCLLIDASEEAYTYGPEYALEAMIHNSKEQSKKRLREAMRLHEVETRRKIGPLHAQREEAQRNQRRDLSKVLNDLESRRNADLREAVQAIDTKYNKLIAETQAAVGANAKEFNDKIAGITDEHERFVVERQQECDAELAAFEELSKICDRVRAETAS
jgi:hypothetical protein